jgi:hypothetical protein
MSVNIKIWWKRISAWINWVITLAVAANQATEGHCNAITAILKQVFHH